MKKILLVLILLFTTSSFSANAESVTAGLLLKPPNEIPEIWQKGLATATERLKIERYTFLVMPLSPKESCYTESLIVIFGEMYPGTNRPKEFPELHTNERGGSRLKRSTSLAVMSSSVLLTLAYEQGYRIEHVTDNYVILTKPIYEKEQQGDKKQ